MALSGVIDVSNNVIITTAIGTVFKDNSAQVIENPKFRIYLLNNFRFM